MKVNQISKMAQGLQSLHGAEVREDFSEKELVFRRTLTDLSGKQHGERVGVLIRDIDEQGKKLSQRADIAEFCKYRQMIRDFIDEVVSNGYAFSKEPSFGARGRQRFFAMVQTVDEKLDALAKEVLSENADSISILNKIDDIRGLILDMFL